MAKKNTVLGVCGSPRARFRDTERAVEMINRIDQYQDLYSTIYELASHKKISNSEALMWMALFGACKGGAEIDIILLNEIYGREEHPSDRQLIELREKVEKAHGVVLSSPVYFGDCTNSINLFLENFSLEGKVVGIVSVGAKRNGGQETTNIYTLMDVLSQGAFIVGNGPPTSQYGGTGWAGDVGAILDDNFGLDTSLGTGRRVTEVIKQTQLNEAESANIAIITSPGFDRDKMLDEISNELLHFDQLEVKTINLNHVHISPCRACSICPKPRKNEMDYGCVVEDDMEMIDQKLLNADGLAFLIDDSSDNANFWATFKKFSERTRHLRRDHFRLADIPVVFFYKKSIERGQILDVKAVTYMLRQNSIICGPCATRFNLGGENHIVFENISMKAACEKLVIQACKRRQTREMNQAREYLYAPIGYKVDVMK